MIKKPSKMDPERNCGDIANGGEVGQSVICNSPMKHPQKKIDQQKLQGKKTLGLEETTGTNVAGGV